MERLVVKMKSNKFKIAYLFLQGSDFGSVDNISVAFALSRSVNLWHLTYSGILFVPIFWSPNNCPFLEFYRYNNYEL